MPEQQPQEQSTKSKKSYSFSKFPLYSNETPVFRQTPNCPFIPNGKRNDYPDYLAYLYNNSGIHSAIVQGKSKYIYGKGFQIKKDWTGDKGKLEKLMNSINGYQSLAEFERKSIFEKTLYGGKYILVDWGPRVTKNGPPISITLLPFNTIRTNEDCTKFWYSKNWTREMSSKSRWKNNSFTKVPEGAIEYPAFSKTAQQGKQVLFIKDDNPATDIYPLPEYEPCKTSIETDIECGFFHLNNVKSGFAAGTMVNFFNGVLEDENAQAEIERDFKAKTTGSDNAGEMVLSFNNPGTTPPTILNLRSNELDKQYEQLAKDVVNKTLQGHRVSNGLLFGIKTPGELGGGRSEFDLAWEHFCNTYVKPKQQEEEEDINYLLSLYGIEGDPLELVVLDPIGIEMTSELIGKTLSPEVLSKLVYERLGIEKPEETNNNEDALTKIQSVSPLIANEILSALTNNEKRALIGLGTIEGGDLIIPKNSWDPNAVQPQDRVQPEAKMSKAFAKFQDDYYLRKFSEIGESADLFEVVLELGKYEDEQQFAAQSVEEKITNILKKNKKISIKDLAGLAGVSQEKVYKILDKLNANNTVAVKYVERGGKVIIEVEEITVKDVELLTKWQYAGPNDSSTRDFCKQLLNANKLYTRAELENMTNEAHTDGFNESVWKYKGGWYHDPVRDVNLPQCRHHWNNIVVRRKQA